MAKSFLLFFVVLAILLIGAVLYFSEPDIFSGDQDDQNQGFVQTLLRKKPAVKKTPEIAIEACKAPTGEQMDYEEAKQIALASDCVKDGTLKETHFCNENTGTWWIDLDITKEGCNPACVIDVISKKAEINWRCTGLLVPQ